MDRRRGDDGGNVDEDEDVLLGDRDAAAAAAAIVIPSASVPLSSASKLRALLDAVAAKRMATQRMRKQRQQQQQQTRNMSQANVDNQAEQAGEVDGDIVKKNNDNDDDDDEEERLVQLQRLRYVSVRFGPAPVSSRRVDHIASFSSFGPTEDGRVKPDIVAPGEITSAAGRAFLDQDVDESVVRVVSGGGGGNGRDVECRVVQISGTSMATPVVAGAATLVRQYFVDGFYPSGRGRASDGFLPTAALVKAALINGAEAMNGFTEVGLPLEPPPSVRQGHGRVHLGRSLPTTAARAVEEPGDTAAGGGSSPESDDEGDVGSSGSSNGSGGGGGGDSGGGSARMFVVDDVPIGHEETHEYCISLTPPPPPPPGRPSSSSSFGGGGGGGEEEGSNDADESNDADDDDDDDELRVTLVWTDPPAMLPSAGPALVNDLDLEVLEVEEEEEEEEPLLSLESNSWAPRDRRNNVERVVIRGATRDGGGGAGGGRGRVAVDPRRYRVVVTGHSVRWVPADDPRGQPYSLVATGPGLVRCGSPAAQVQVEQQQQRRGQDEKMKERGEQETSSSSPSAPPTTRYTKPTNPSSQPTSPPSSSASPSDAATSSSPGSSSAPTGPGTVAEEEQQVTPPIQLAPGEPDSGSAAPTSPGAPSTPSASEPYTSPSYPRPAPAVVEAPRGPIKRQCRWWEYLNPDCW